MDFGYENIKTARERISDYVIETPLIKSWALSELTGVDIYLKLENLQVTGSFKYRGAMNAILSLDKDDMKNGIVAASSGNHGKALAYAGKKLGIKTTIVIPNSAPDIKKKAIKDLGAEIVECETEKRFEIAEDLANKTGGNLIPPYDYLPVMEGQGTLGLEILEQNDDLDYVFIPVSGGGLIGGVSKAIKSKNKDIKVIGVESEILPRYSKSLEAGKRVEVKSNKSFADALASNKPGEINFPVVKENVDEVVTVSEDGIKKAVKTMLMEGKVLAEGAGAISLAAIMERKLDLQKDDKVCLVISGGSISMDQLKNL